MKFKLATMAAAMFAATGAASAADLGRPAPAAVDYVKVCDAYGAGFFYIPGSQTCLKIGGYVRAEYRAYDFDDGFAALSG
ncbi:porin, partial [Prosthecomicrobium hirschii]